jgi:tetratricopeptide (TPR) repeat protein
VLRLARGGESRGKAADRAKKGSAPERTRDKATTARATNARTGAARATTARAGVDRTKRKSGSKAATGEGSAIRKRRRPTEATEELRRLAGGNANRAVDTLARASEAFARGRERDALRILRPLTEAYPTAVAVRELAGLCRYRIGSYAAAADDLAAFAELSGSTEQHPVLMDCRRAQGKLRDVEELWEELRETSPSAELVTEGRIVVAGAFADAGRLTEAIDLLARRAEVPGRTKEHTVRLWYALADLEERAGDVPRARALFEQVQRFDAEFADVAERLAALS